MNSIRFSELNFPKALNLHLISVLLTEKEMMNLIKCYADKPRKERRIVLPSQSCLRKVIVYFLMTKYKGNYAEVLKKLKGDKSLGEQALQKSNILRLYENRLKELENEK